MLNSDGEQIDLLTQELEKVDRVEPVTTIGGIAGQDGAIINSLRERTSSSAQITGSDGGISVAENEKLLVQQVLINSSSSPKMSIDSPNSSGRNTPTLSSRQKRQLFRAETSTPPPPSLTGGSSSSDKNRSLT